MKGGRTPLIEAGNCLAIIGALIALASASVAQAQDWLAPPPPVRSSIDANGVDLGTGYYTHKTNDIAIGDLSFDRWYFQVKDGEDLKAGWRDSSVAVITVEANVYTVAFGGRSESFSYSGGVYTSLQGTRSKLTLSGQTYTYTAGDGTVALFSTLYDSEIGHLDATARATEITSPTGEKLSFTYKCASASAVTSCGSGGYRNVRLQSINSNRGFQLKFEYASNTISGSTDDWMRLTKVTAINNSVEYCDPSADSCSLTQTWPTVTYEEPSSTTWAVSDSLDREIRYTYASGASDIEGPRLTGIRSPMSSSDDVTITYYTTTSTNAWSNHNGRVASVTRGGLTWTYSYSTESGGSERVITVTGPGSATTTVKQTQTSGLWLVSSETNAVNKTTSYTYDSFGRLTRITHPEGNYVQNTYDSAGNVTETVAVGKSGSGLSEVVREADFYSGCPSGQPTCSVPCNYNSVVCHKPSAVTANGVTTTYTYDPDHGGLTKSTVNGVETRYSYTELSAWYKNSSGTIVESPTSIYLLTGVSTCVSGNSCANSASEVKTTITYGAENTANNLLPTATSKGAGNGSLSASATIEYDIYGRVSTVDGPLSGSDDLIKRRYNLAGQLVGVVGPDPDGATTTLKHRATRTTYNDNGLVTKVEAGTVNSQSDADWANFTVLDYEQTTYDAQYRRTKTEIFSGANALQGVVQYSYDSRGRLECAAQRMNASAFSSLPSSACSLSTQGSAGPDRITKITYDDANRVLKQTSAYGTALEQDTTTYTYTNNGRVATELHGASSSVTGVLTTYEYDGLDRLKKTRFPNETTSGSSFTDYIENTYSGLRLELIRMRDGKHVLFDYDGAGRVDEVRYGTGTTPSDFIYRYTYDNLGRRTEVELDPSVGATVTVATAWDALSRNTSETSDLGTVSYEYDLAGRRTKMTWPDSFYVNYDWSVAGELLKIRENGATSGAGVLATYTYDARGRRSGVTYGNGVATTYSFDAASRLSSLAHNLDGTTNDYSVSYTRNQAGQILSRTTTGDVYEPTPPSPLTPATTYSHNGLNELIALGTNWVSHDDRGNLTGDGVNTYTYNLMNQLTGVSGATLEYDALGRLAKTAGGSTTRFMYDGADMIAEYNSSGTTLQRRYVHGPAVDEPIVWYEGSGTTDRRWLVADQLGSIIAVTNGSGAATAINKYDEYGKPDAANQGRFQYTGQMWIPEIGLYHYKARAYSPTIGRFLQTDPIGYDGGLNLYAYVANDPTNLIDPSGLTVTEVGEIVSTGTRRCRSCSISPRPGDIGNPNPGDTGNPNHGGRPVTAKLTGGGPGAPSVQPKTPTVTPPAPSTEKEKDKGCPTGGQSGQMGAAGQALQGAGQAESYKGEMLDHIRSGSGKWVRTPGGVLDFGGQALEVGGEIKNGVSPGRALARGGGRWIAPTGMASTGLLWGQRLCGDLCAMAGGIIGGLLGTASKLGDDTEAAAEDIYNRVTDEDC